MKFRFAPFLLALLLVIGAPAAAEGDPAAPIHLLCDSLIEVMKRGKELGFEGRETRLKPVVSSVYDMAALTKNTLGVAGNKLTPDEAVQLAEAYNRFSIATYADQFAVWEGEHFEIEAPRSLPNGGTVVPSFIIGGDGSRTAIDYVMHETPSGWRIIDVLFQGAVSQVAVRRSEFLPIYRQNGVAALIAMLDGKAQALAKR